MIKLTLLLLVSMVVLQTTSLSQFPRPSSFPPFSPSPKVDLTTSAFQDQCLSAVN